MCTKGKRRCAMTEMESRTPKLTRGRKAEKRKREETDEEADEEELAKEKRIVTRMQAEMEREYTGWRKYVEQELKVTSNRLVVVCEAVRTIRDDVKQIAAIAADTLLAVERLERRLDEEQEEALEKDEEQAEVLEKDEEAEDPEEPEEERMAVDAPDDADAEHEEEGPEKEAEENAGGDAEETLKE